MTELTAQTTELLQAVFSVVLLVFVVMAVSNKVAHTIRKNMVE